MNPKTTIVLIVLLLVAVIGVWWAQTSSREAGVSTEPAGPEALIDPPLGVLSGFELKCGDSPAFVFVREDDKWRMTAPAAGPSEHYKVDGDATRVKNLKYVKAFGVDDPDRPTAEMASLDHPTRIVKLTDEEGRSCVLKIGSQQLLSKKTYVQKEGDERIYLVEADLNHDLRRDLSDYRGKRLAEFQTGDAVRVEVAGAHQYTLVKRGGTWMVDSPHKCRADSGGVARLLSSLSGLNAVSFVSDDTQNLRPFGLASPQLTVRVTTEKKTPKTPLPPPASAPAEPEYETVTKTVGVLFGGTAEEKVFAKLDDAADSVIFQVEADVLGRVAPALEGLRDKKIATIDTKHVQKLVVSCGGESVELMKSGGKWRISGNGGDESGTAAEYAAVHDLLKAVRDLEAIGFELQEQPSYGFASPRVTIEVTSEGRLEPTTLVVGGLTPSKTGAYVRNDGEGFIAVVKAESAESLLARPIAFSSRQLLRFTRARASKMELARGGLTCEVGRDGAVWKFAAPVQGDAEFGAVSNILSDLSNLRGRRVVGRPSDAAKFGLDSPAVSVTVLVEAPVPTTTSPTTASSSSQPVAKVETPARPPTAHTVLISRHDEKVYAMVEGGRTICEVDAKVLEDLEAELLDTRVATIDPSDGRRLSFGGAGGFSFEKRDGQWGLDGEPSFPVDETEINKMFEALRDMRAKRYICYKNADLGDYGLDRPEVMVTAATGGGVSRTLLISATGPGGGDRYATTPGGMVAFS